MSKRPFIVFGIFAAICLVAIPYFAFAKEGETGLVEVASADAEEKELFANNCGYCHTLAAAGTDGVVGPNLDDVLVTTGVNTPEQYEGLYQRVLNAVACGIPAGGGRMPDRILIGEEAQEVASFVAAYAGQIGKGPTVDLETAERAEAGECPVADPGAPGDDESTGASSSDDAAG